MNYFETKNTAERYGQGRPYFHAGTIAKVKVHLHIKHPFDRALDVACGTGLSTRALLDIAAEVYGTDVSAEMIRLAFQHEHIHYLLAKAEEQPFEAHFFELITVCSGVHWFEIDRFLQEANRLLKPGGWLVLYDNYFLGEMQDVAAFSAWFENTYLKHFPAPPRNDAYEWTNEKLSGRNFRLDFEDTFRNEVRFTINSLALYLSTQSNVTAKVKAGQITYPELESWLKKELSSFFEEEVRTLYFGNWIKYLQQQNASIV